VADATVFVELRPVLFGIAYRMLGSAADADDVLQEAWIRWDRVDESSVESPRAYLKTIVTRLSIDQLRVAKARRETYRGPWLPDPIAVGGDPDTSMRLSEDVPDADVAEQAGADLADSLSMAFLVLLEELGPVERAAFLLREVFGYAYPEIAGALDRSEVSCRQLVSRARHRIGDRRRRFDADREMTAELTRRFVVACGTGDIDGLMSLLAEDVVIWTDGGGLAKAAPRPVVGPWRAARWLTHVAKTFPEGTEIKEATLNGQPGVLFYLEGVVTNAVVVDVIGGLISGVRVVANPEKLAALRSAGPSALT
jgi:RNA polymerase sigma-70 factor, ECF subfamily